MIPQRPAHLPTVILLGRLGQAPIAEVVWGAASVGLLAPAAGSRTPRCSPLGIIEGRKGQANREGTEERPQEKIAVQHRLRPVEMVGEDFLVRMDEEARLEAVRGIRPEVHVARAELLTPKVSSARKV